jgi:haloacetate dehalogenase
VIERLATPEGEVAARVAGSGPPLLLLHGYPQDHRMWDGTIEALAGRFTVVAADLPGYGESYRPVPAADHAPHSKRRWAAALVAAMGSLGFGRFAVAGHDRGGRVAYRMALDRPDVVTALAVLDVVPTGEVWARADRTFALGYWHWSFLAQPAPLPESLILADPDAYHADHVARIGLASDRWLDQLRDPATVEAICEDYRAGATIDVEIDGEGGTITCPTLALWAAHGALPRFYANPLAIWREWAADVRGATTDTSHFMVDDAPAEVAQALLDFLR